MAYSRDFEDRDLELPEEEEDKDGLIRDYFFREASSFCLKTMHTVWARAVIFSYLKAMCLS